MFCCPGPSCIWGQFGQRVSFLGGIKSWVLPQKRKYYFNLVRYSDTTLLLKFRIMESFRFGKTSKLIKSSLPLNTTTKYQSDTEMAPWKLTAPKVQGVSSWNLFCSTNLTLLLCFHTAEHAGTAAAPWGSIFNAYPILPVPHNQVLKAAALSSLMAADSSISWTSSPGTSYALGMFATTILQLILPPVSDLHAFALIS